MKRFVYLCSAVLFGIASLNAAAASLTVVNSGTDCSKNCVETIKTKGGLTYVLRTSTGEVLKAISVDLPADAVFMGAAGTSNSTPAGNSGGIRMNATDTPGAVTTTTNTYITPTEIIVVTTFSYYVNGVLTDVQVTITRFTRTGIAK